MMEPAVAVNIKNTESHESVPILYESPKIPEVTYDTTNTVLTMTCSSKIYCSQYISSYAMS